MWALPEIIDFMQVIWVVMVQERIAEEQNQHMWFVVF